MKVLNGGKPVDGWIELRDVATTQHRDSCGVRTHKSIDKHAKTSSYFRVADIVLVGDTGDAYSGGHGVDSAFVYLKGDSTPVLVGRTPGDVVAMVAREDAKHDKRIAGLERCQAGLLALKPLADWLAAQVKGGD